MIQADFTKYADGLMPVIIQDHITLKVLMLGFMNAEAFQKTETEKRVVFYSRSKQRLWMKGETSHNYLNVKNMQLDCDADTILIQVMPDGPVCHTGADTCFGEKNMSADFIKQLEMVIHERRIGNDEKSYVKNLFDKGINKIAQKVGEEAVEVVIEAKDNNDDLFLNETADLFFHYLILLQAKGFKMEDVLVVLRERHIKA
jgi:phosphoribosyl-AMP cyclohydrolase / phosphoribosyl-ATP pyrophosphohydrolase